MFSRRVLQRSLNDLATSLSRDQLERLVGRLNSPTLDQISAEWELVVLAAIGRLGDLKHEFDSGGSSRPDIRTRIDGLEFVADVVTVSDTDVDDENPVEFFRSEITALARSLGMSGAGLFLRVDDATNRTRRERRLLALPRKGEVPQFVRRVVGPFLRRIATQRDRSDQLAHSDSDVSFQLEYRAGEQFSGGGWSIFTNPRSPKHNPLYRNLDDKSGQLRRSGFAGVKGIIACDGGCELFAGRVDRILEAYFRQHRETISFVTLIDVPDLGSRSSSASLQPRVRTCWNPSHAGKEAVMQVIARIGDQLPRALSASRYARNRPLTPDFRYHNSHEGASRIEYQGSHETIRISSRALLLALGGHIRHRPGWAPADYSIPVRVFQAQLKEGRVIKAIRIEPSEVDDDDWIVLEFDGPDASVTTFHVPADGQS